MGFKANYFSPLEFRCQSIACRKLSVSEAIDTHALHVRVLNGLAPVIDWGAAMKAAADAVHASGIGATSPLVEIPSPVISTPADSKSQVVDPAKPIPSSEAY